MPTLKGGQGGLARAGAAGATVTGHFGNVAEEQRTTTSQMQSESFELGLVQQNSWT